MSRRGVGSGTENSCVSWPLRGSTKESAVSGGFPGTGNNLSKDRWPETAQTGPESLYNSVQQESEKDGC